MEFTNFVVMIVVSVGLSLGCSYILFKTLKSSATIKKPKVRLGGAIAGFLVILGLLLNTFNIWYEKETKKKWEPQTWTIVAQFARNGNNGSHNGNNNRKEIIGRVMPSRTDRMEGDFLWVEFDKTPDEDWPIIQFEQGDYTHTLTQLEEWIDDNNTEEIKLDDHNKKITLKKAIVLERMGG